MIWISSILILQVYGDIHGKRRNEEAYGSLDEICELSLSVTPMEDRESWPGTDGHSQLSTSSIDNNFANFPHFHSHHLNLDLTIWLILIYFLI